MRDILTCVLGLGLAFGEPAGGLQAAAQEKSQKRATHLVASIRGTLQVQREGWTSFQPIRPGTLLSNDDLLRLPAGSHAEIICSDLQPKPVIEPVGDVPCPSVAVAITDRGSKMARFRGPSGGASVLLAPRNTAVATDRPVFRWEPVQGATSYKLHLRGEGQPPWSFETKGDPRLAYPGQPPLSPGKTYLATVVAGGAPPRDRDAWVEVRILDVPSQREVAARIEQVRKLRLEPIAEALVLAHVQASNGLLADAIATLEGQAGGKDPAILLLLGDLEQEVGLARHAASRYLEILSASPEPGDLEIHALASEHFGNLLESQGNTSAAATRLADARDLYKRLGAAPEAARMEQRLKKGT